MFSKLFDRSKAASQTPSNTLPAPLPAQPEQQAPVAVNRLEAFKKEWDERETANEVIEGNGGDTDWGLWTDVMENEQKSFGPTTPMPLMKE